MSSFNHAIVRIRNYVGEWIFATLAPRSFTVHVPEEGMAEVEVSWLYMVRAIDRSRLTATLTPVIDVRKEAKQEKAPG